MYYLNIFFVFSFIGFALETILSKFFHTVFYSGILFGPWTIIYGVGALVILFIYNFLDKKINSNRVKVVLLFFISAFILSFIEWCGGNLIEIIFNKVYWNYESMKYNIGHYVSLEISLIWGLASIILIYLIMPFLKKIIDKIPKWITYLLLILFLIDLLVTLIIK